MFAPRTHQEWGEGAHEVDAEVQLFVRRQPCEQLALRPKTQRRITSPAAGSRCCRRLAETAVRGGARARARAWSTPLMLSARRPAGASSESPTYPEQATARL